MSNEKESSKVKLDSTSISLQGSTYIDFAILSCNEMNVDQTQPQSHLIKEELIKII